MNNKKILVAGATGRQGGAVARHLFEDGWHVRGLTRDAQKPKARELSSMGIEVVEGDLNTITADHPAFKDLYGIFSVETFAEDGVEGEIRQGKRLADIAKEVMVEHFIYSSVGGADRNTGIPHFESKWQIELHISRLALPASIIRPVFFMENLNDPGIRSTILDGRLTLPMDPDKPLQMIAVDDIGGIVTLLFDSPEPNIDKAIEIAGDELTLPQVAKIFSQTIDRTVGFVRMPIEEMRKSSPEMATMFDWFNREGYQADIAALRMLYPELKDFKDWLETTDWPQQKEAHEAASRG